MASSWVVYGPQGQVLRRFTDTDGNNKVDTFRYYNLGIEVYRDIDSNKNEKMDQHRWLNTGGTRWGIDRDEDGIFDADESRLPVAFAGQVLVTIWEESKIVSVALEKDGATLKGTTRDVITGDATFRPVAFTVDDAGYRIDVRQGRVSR